MTHTDNIKAIRTNIESSGFKVIVEHTGGGCMLGILQLNGFWIGFNDDSVYVYEGSWFDDSDYEAWEAMMENFKVLVEWNDGDTDEVFVNLAVDAIRTELASRNAQAPVSVGA